MRSFRGLACALIIAAAPSLSHDAIADERWEFASIMPPSHFAAEISSDFAAKITEATNGEVKVAIHLSGALGLRGPDMLNAVRDRLAHLADMQMNQQVGEALIFGAESAPCLARSFDELRALQHYTRPVFEAYAERHNQKILYIYPLSPQNIFIRNTEKFRRQGFSGLRVRTIDRNGTDFFAALGAVPIQMPWAEVTPALATGVIDAVATSSPTGVSGQFWDFLDELILLRWQMNSFMVSVNLDAWNNLPVEHQNSITLLAKQTEDILWAASRKSEAESEDILRRQGLSVVEMTGQTAAQINLSCSTLSENTHSQLPPAMQQAINEFQSMQRN